MFTGIVEFIGQVLEIETSGDNKSYWIESPIISEIKIDQSIAHNGVCLTVDKVESDAYRVTAIRETLLKTTLDTWQKGDKLNLERCLLVNGRLDGHFVQGHVDGLAICIDKEEKNGSWNFKFEIAPSFAKLVIEKGSICLDGISLTSHSIYENQFIVSIIPYTYENTISNQWNIGKKSNVEFDILGKYFQRHLQVERQ